MLAIRKADSPDEVLTVNVLGVTDEDGSRVPISDLNFSFESDNETAVKVSTAAEPNQARLTYVRANEDGSANIGNVTCRITNGSGRELGIGTLTVPVVPGDGVSLVGVELELSPLPEDEPTPETPAETPAE